MATDQELQELAHQAEASLQRLQGFQDAMQKQLLLAGRVQRALFPTPFNSDYYDFHIRTEAHFEVSGDIVDFPTAGGSKVASAFVGDASGHDVSAAIVTILLHAGIQALPRGCLPSDAIRELNNRLCVRDTGMFATGVFFSLFPNGRVSLCGAGHDPVLYVPADGSPVQELDSSGMALGMFAEEPVPYQNVWIDMQKGDRLYVYTDALTEARSDQDDPTSQFGLKAFHAQVDASRSLPAKAAIDQIWSHVQSFSGRDDFADDATLAVFEFQPKK